MENKSEQEIIFSDRTLARRLERAEAQSNAGFVEARRQLFPQSLAEWIEVAGAYAMFDGVQSPVTQTFGLGLFDSVTNAELDQLEIFFKERDAQVFHEISPLADISLLPLLNERGYQPIEFTSVMHRPVRRGASLDVSLNPKIQTRIIEAGEEEIWAQTAAKGWSTEGTGLSDFMFGIGQISAKSGLAFLAELDQRQIATGVLFIHEGVALLAGASTVSEGRRQGAQLALLDARLRYAAEKGCDIAMMGALPGSPSQRNAERHGFRIAYTRIKWQLTN